MASDEQVEAAAAAAAEKANGGKFSDPLFYKPEHKKFWRDVVRAALTVAEIKSLSKAPAKATAGEVETFSSHCVYMRSIYTIATRNWCDRSEAERKTMEKIAPSFFEDIGQFLAEAIVNCACRITERAVDGRGNEKSDGRAFSQRVCR